MPPAESPRARKGTSAGPLQPTADAAAGALDAEQPIAPLRMELRGGRLHFSATEGTDVALSDVTVGLVIRRGRRRMCWEAEALRADGLGALWAETGLRIELRSETVDGALVLHSSVENSGAEPVLLEEITPLLVRAPRGNLRVGADSRAWSVFRNGYQSWSGTRAYRVDEADADPRFAFLRDMHVDPQHPAASRAGVIRSDLVGAVVDRPTGVAVAVGVVETSTCLATVLVDAPRGRFRALAVTLDLDGVGLAPGERRELPPVWIAAGRDGEALLAAWASATGRAMQARVAERSPVGWCSWYYYFTRVRESDVVGNLEPLAALRDRVRCDYVMIDDGYQRAIGDWLEPNQKFPHGLRWLAERIRAAGFEPGIWLAPFLVRPEAALFRARPEWLLRRPSGRLRAACWNPGWSWRTPAYALDTTHPEVLDWLSQLARVLVQQWGFRVLKLDFLYAAALPAALHDPTATRALALRRGLQAIREGAGEEAFLIGCGCPLGPAIGIVDAMRIGPDVAPLWTSWISRWLLRGRHGVATKHALRNALTRSFMHRRLWLNDPDCVIARDSETQLTVEEVRTLAATVGLTDGLFVMSDRMDALTDERRALLADAHQLLGGAPRIADLFERDIPEEVHCAYPDGEVRAAFNFSERPRPRTLPYDGDSDGAVLREVWTDEAVALADHQLVVGTVPAHGCRLVWRPRSEVG